MKTLSSVLFVAVLFILLMLFSGCYSPPSHYSIDPELTQDEHTIIRDVIAAWCEAVDYCPEEASWTDRGRFTLVDHLSQRGMGKCPEGRTCSLTARNSDDRILIARDGVTRAYPHMFWVQIAHEIGHYCTEHTDTGLMAAVQNIDSPAEIDAVAIAAWKEGCQ